MTPKLPSRGGPLTNKHLRVMAWAAFAVAVALAVFAAASDAVIMAFLTSAASSLGLVQARNVGEDIVAGRPDAGGSDAVETLDASKV